MGDEDESSSGLKLLAQHLANVKLDFAERDAASQYTIRAQENRIEELEDLLADAREDIECYKKDVVELQKASSIKWRVKQVSEWKSLVQTLRAENAELRKKLESQNDATTDDEKQGESDGKAVATPTNHAEKSLMNGTCCDVTNSHRGSVSSCGCEDAQALRLLIEEKDFEIEALKEKLNLELELKWERSHSGWQRSLLDSFVEIVAPKPQHTYKVPSNSDGDTMPTRSVVV